MKRGNIKRIRNDQNKSVDTIVTTNEVLLAFGSVAKADKGYSVGVDEDDSDGVIYIGTINDTEKRSIKSNGMVTFQSNK